MNNPAIARMFNEIADILEITGDNPFRIRSYRRAAQTIETLTRELREMDEAKWRDVPGIGEGLARKIKEFLTTGACHEHEELKKKIPLGLLEMVKIPGLGPKTVKKLYDELKIQNLEDLEKAARAKKIQGVYGLGPKVEEKILKGIDLKRKYKERFLLGKAYPLAQSLLQSLQEKAPVEQICLAGSLRRMRETVADIDILATSRKPEKVIEIFSTLPEVKEILAKGETKCSILTTAGIQSDLRVVAQSSYGAALHYFTGSKGHNIRIREMGVKKGLKINEYGIFKADTEKLLGGKTEEEVFEAVGLPYIPPELREDWGEVEAALEGRLPNLITVEDLLSDLHDHTEWSDGANTIEEMANGAMKAGYRYLAITDHSKAVGITGGMDAAELRKQIAEIRKVNGKVKPFRILAGTEVDIKPDGSLDLPDDVLEELDWVVASVHIKFGMTEEEMTGRIIKAMEHPCVNVIGHPTGRLIGSREPYPVNIDHLVEAAKRTGTFLEINAFWDRLDLSDLHARKAKEGGVTLTISNDAHNTSHFSMAKFGVATARRAWVEAKQVANTFSVDRLMGLVQKKRREANSTLPGKSR